MANTKTLEELRNAAKRRADMERSNFLTDEEWDENINDSGKWLHNLLVDTYADEYYHKKETFATVADQEDYDLPNDFFKLLGVDVQNAQTADNWVSVGKYQFHERNSRLQFSFLHDFRYRLRGDQINIIPLPRAGHTFRLHYIPCFEILEDDDDDLTQEINGYAELVVIDAALKALRKEESDTTELMAEKFSMIQQIQGSAINRDASFPERVVDLDEVPFEEDYWR